MKLTTMNKISKIIKTLNLPIIEEYEIRVNKIKEVIDLGIISGFNGIIINKDNYSYHINGLSIRRINLSKPNCLFEINFQNTKITSIMYRKENSCHGMIKSHSFVNIINFYWDGKFLK